MSQPSLFLTSSNTILWLKVVLSAATLVLLYVRYRRGKQSGGPARAHSFQTKLLLGAAVVFSFAVFHDLGKFAGGKFIHYGDMFHYYFGSKYFKELGYFELYNAVVVADAEQGNALAGLPFYTDLKTYAKTRRETVLGDIDRVKSLFSPERWSAFKGDVAYFKQANGARGLASSLMDHGYNASPASTLVLSTLSNMVPVTQLRLLAVLDVLLVLTMVGLVFRNFGLEVGAAFSVYFFVNALSGHEYISGSLLRYDWVLYIVVAVCLLDKGRYAASAFFLTLSAMMRIFPAVLFWGVAVGMARKLRTTRSLDKQSVQFVTAAGATALVLFFLPAISLGSAHQPWQDFYEKTQLHAGGVYVNHLGLRGMVLFEPSHLSLERFAEAYKSADIVRHWQDVKEIEFRAKRPIILFASFLVLIGVTAITWRSQASAGASSLWSMLLVYTTAYLSSYYYAFLCLFVLLFLARRQSRDALVPMGLLLVTNIAALVTDSFGPSPIVLFTLINLYLFTCLASILCFELYFDVFKGRSSGAVGGSEPLRRARAQGKARRK